jgi:hypothetical protein
MAAKLGNVSVFYVNRAGAFAGSYSEGTKCFPLELSRIKPLQGINYPHTPLWHSLCFKKRVPISHFKIKKIVSLRYVLVNENFFFYGLGFRG